MVQMEVSGCKTIVFIRHGHALHSDGAWNVHDPQLSHLGREQVLHSAKMIRRGLGWCLSVAHVAQRGSGKSVEERDEV